MGKRKGYKEYLTMVQSFLCFLLHRRKHETLDGENAIDMIPMKFPYRNFIELPVDIDLKDLKKKTTDER